ncbi:MAG: isoprenyl transferase [Clostridiales bacterium]|uniref:Isoprenyl transferase n=1 Tax=Harryflintia acetispora TaxID=1849041 RepID=A0A9X8UIT8_9FIRM|nr:MULTISPECIES: isoprenyl transferase [Oscillospiraceae]PWM36337.1 MAG: isoprenyl transferase [Clostridiales bacterium]RGB64587.1 isoprenyl transferase [Harryflintia acetispora]TCL42764.1 undecaprenyl diphosphate synthase [Harryflintia acetispora]
MDYKPLLERLKGIELPRHVGIIMDGNGRWAQKRMLPRSAGHREGANTFGKIARFARECGIKYITFYAFSTENWRRPEQEVRELMELLHKFLRDSYKYKDENIRTLFLGDLSPLSDALKAEIKRVEEGSADNTGLTVNIALNYGSRDEIVRAARALARDAKAGAIDPEAVDEQALSDRLYTAGMPDCDLVIRPSGEQRLSNFLLWQSAYAEFVFMDILWPDFGEEDFTNAVLEYARRSRRFGGIG